MSPAQYIAHVLAPAIGMAIFVAVLWGWAIGLGGAA